MATHRPRSPPPAASYRPRSPPPPRAHRDIQPEEQYEYIPEDALVLDDGDSADAQDYNAGPPTSSGYTSEMEPEVRDDQDDSEDQPRPARYISRYSSPSIEDLTHLDDEADLEPDTTTSHNKRPRSPSTDDEKLPPTPKAVKIIDHAGRARQQDYDTVVKEIIKVAIDLYEVKLLTVCGFPSSSMEAEWVTEVWADACLREGVKYRITSDLYKMVCGLGFEFMIILI